MKKLLSKATPEQQKPQFVKPSVPNYAQRWIAQGLMQLENEFGVLFKREVEYPYDYKHGHYELQQLFDVLEMWGQRGDHPYKATYEDELVFFDTETTGLKGTGTHIFLLGFLTVEDDCFRLTQYVLADPSNEVAFLFESKLWRPGKSLVSYNGKSFDWPQVETRWTLNRTHLPPLKTQRQIDLLHSTKRLWKNDMKQLKLTKVEEEKLGFVRQGDIPGFLAPIIYLDAIKSGEASALMKVLHHNEWDLLSLITLYIHSSKLLFDQQLTESATTYTNIGKWHKDTKNLGASSEVLEHVIQNFEADESAVARYYLAYELKKQGQFIEARQAFCESIPYLPLRDQLKAYEQMAIIEEHKMKELQQAYISTNRCLEIAYSFELWTDAQRERQLHKLMIRKQRIEKKLNQ